MKNSANTDVNSRLQQLGIVLPEMAPVLGAYVKYQQLHNTLYVSGHIAKKNDGSIWVGKLGRDMTTAEGIAAARWIAIDLMTTLKAAVSDLNRIRIIKLMGLVNSTDTFTEHHLVINGASELLLEVFGEQGRHARSAFGVAQIPTGSCVEIELIAEVCS